MKCLACVKTISSSLLITFFVITLTASFAAAVQPECQKIEICHKPEYITIILEVETGVNGQDKCIDSDGLADHLGHGDTVGPCVTSPAN